ncbi:MAG: hypothetical protein JEZ06_06565 [Anaerolineaceae bacterium]|nr:hypothetical protein [Anaerolineaceae bacterium]
MNNEMADIELIEKYIIQVGNYLPRKNREDIKNELRSSIVDAVEDQYEGEGNNDSNQMTFQVINSYGSPEKVAASYLPKRSLIGPQLFPTFLTVLKIVLVIMIIQSVIVLVEIGISGGSWVSTRQDIGEYLLFFGRNILESFGSIVLIFAFLEIVLIPRSRKVDNWTPAQLDKPLPSDQPSLASLFVKIGFSIFLAIIINFYPYKIGFLNQYGDQWMLFPILGKGFIQFLPWINIYLVGQIVFNLYILSSRTWNRWTFWVDILITSFGIGILISLLRAPSILGIQDGYYHLAGWQEIPDFDIFLMIGGPNLGILLFRLLLGGILVSVLIKMIRKIIIEMKKNNYFLTLQK